jgi:hypothetical protein
MLTAGSNYLGESGFCHKAMGMAACLEKRMRETSCSGQGAEERPPGYSGSHQHCAAVRQKVPLVRGEKCRGVAVDTEAWILKRSRKLGETNS